MVVPARMLSRGRARDAPVAREIAEIGSLHPRGLLELGVPPEFAGDESALDPRLIGDTPFFPSIYLGAPVLALAAAALGRGRRVSLWLAVVAALGVLLACGWHLPLHAVVRVLVPPLAYMRCPRNTSS